MGAWATDSFGCDEACDWADRLRRSTDFVAVETALDEVLATADDVELHALAGIGAICAAEAVARLQGRFGLRDAYSQDVDDWVERVALQPSPALVDKARRALDRVLAERSELRLLWEDAGDLVVAWRAGVQELKVRVG